MSQSPLSVIREALYAAKFALEQDLEGAEKEKVIRQIRDALDLTGPANENNPLLVTTLSNSLADPFDDIEAPTAPKKRK